MTASVAPPQLANLPPLAQLRAGRVPERLARLILGLALYGVSIALLVEGGIGAAPWDVFHVGAADHLPVGFGATIVATAALVLAAWVPLGQMPGVGTVANALLLGPFAALALRVVPTAGPHLLRIAFLAAGIVLCAAATALYVGAQLGPGPRDGLMTGLARRTGWPIRTVRTAIELIVLGTGMALGGTAGPGTAVFALAVGPATQRFLRHLVVPLDLPTNPPPRSTHAPAPRR